MPQTASKVDVSAPVTSAKRQQILDGARRVFLSNGFDAASVNDLAMAAGVSKATLYAYFPSKERLFETLVFEDRRHQAEQIFDFESGVAPMAEVLRKIGRRLCANILQPASVAYSRTVIAASARFPELGQAFYEAGPAYGAGRLASILKARSDAGEIAVDDPELAAHQFLDLCLSGIIKPLMFGLRETPSEEMLHMRIDEAVKMVMARYGRNS